MRIVPHAAANTDAVDADAARVLTTVDEASGAQREAEPHKIPRNSSGADALPRCPLDADSSHLLSFDPSTRRSSSSRKRDRRFSNTL